MAKNDGIVGGRNPESMWESSPSAAALIGHIGADGTARPVSQANPLTMTDAKPPADWVGYLTAGPGTATAIPVVGGVKVAYLSIVPINAETVWFRVGGSGVTAAVPAGNVSDGTASRALPGGASILIAVGSATHYAVSSVGPISIEGWLG